MDTLFKHGYDGINLGNTSTDYAQARVRVAMRIKTIWLLYRKFAGGVGGNGLKSKSLFLCEEAVKYRGLVKPGYEFHIIRSGGVDCLADISDSIQSVFYESMVHRIFTNYLKHGNKVYQELFK